MGCIHTHSPAGLTRARGQHTQVHLRGVCTHRQPRRAHQGAGSVHTGTPAWGVHTQPRRAHQGPGSVHTGTPAWGVHTHSHAGLTKVRDLNTQAHMRAVYMGTQPHGAHQGTVAVLCSLCGWRGLSGQGRGPSSGQTWEQTAQCLVFQPKEFGLCEQLLRKGFSSGNSLILLPPVHPCQRVSPLLFP